MLNGIGLHANGNGAGKKIKKIMFAVMPYEGEIREHIMPEFFKNKAVKYMPLGLLSLAACVPEQYEIKVLDASSRGMSLDETIEEIESFAPDVLGLSVVTYRAWAMVQVLQRTTAPIKVVGGPHTTFNADKILNQGADAVFIGDAEVSFVKWLEDGCPNGIFRSPPIPLDDLPLPARHLMNIEDYAIEDTDNLMFNVGKYRMVMYSSKGCPYECIYCDVQQKTFNFKSPSRCAEEFRELIDIGATSIHILDDAFNIQKDRVRELARHLDAEDIQIDWSARGTVEVRESVIADLAAAGCKRFHVGIEHLDDKVLEFMKKGSRFKHIQNFTDLCHKYGISILAYFILGSPMETEEYRTNLPEMIEGLGIRLPYFNLLSPLNETPFYRSLLLDGTFKRDYWAEFCENPVKDFIMPTHRTLEEERELRSIMEEYVEHFQELRRPAFVG